MSERRVFVSRCLCSSRVPNLDFSQGASFFFSALAQVLLDFCYTYSHHNVPCPHRQRRGVRFFFYTLVLGVNARLPEGVLACHNPLVGVGGVFMGCQRIDCSLKGSNKTVQRGILRDGKREKVTSNASGKGGDGSRRRAKGK